MKTESVQRVWSRRLPGGGFTAIDVSEAHGVRQSDAFRGALIVERRAEPRRVGHVPPIVAEARGATIEAIIQELLPTGESNTALGTALLKRQHARA